MGSPLDSPGKGMEWVAMSFSRDIYQQSDNTKT